MAFEMLFEMALSTLILADKRSAASFKDLIEAIAEVTSVPSPFFGRMGGV
jgi:hypothetical protein